MLNNSAKRSGSSQGRGGKTTQQETHKLSKVDLTQIVKETTQRRRFAKSWNEQLGQEVEIETHEIDLVLQEALRKYSQNLAEVKIIQLIREYISNDKSAMLEVRSGA